MAIEGVGHLLEGVALLLRCEDLDVSFAGQLPIDNVKVLHLMHVLHDDDTHDPCIIIAGLRLSGPGPQVVVFFVRIVIMNLKLVFIITNRHNVCVAITIDISNGHNLHPIDKFSIIEPEFCIVESFV